jgi:hypothetical protein
LKKRTTNFPNSGSTAVGFYSLDLELNPCGQGRSARRWLRIQDSQPT